MSATESQGGAESGASISRGIEVPECPVRSNLKREIWVSNGCLLGNILEVPERGLTLREAGSVLLGTIQDPKLLHLLQCNELGLSNFRLLNDGEFYELYEWVFDYPPGCLGPGGREGYSFKNSLLDSPSQHVTAAASSYLAWALAELKKMMGVKLDAASVKTLKSSDRLICRTMSVKTLKSSDRLICRTLFKKLFYEAGHSPLK